jgi:hypothetical protein
VAKGEAMSRFAALGAALTCISTAAAAQIPPALGWYALPGTEAENACQFPSGPNSGGSGCAALTTAWTGALFDTSRNRMVFGWGGGHGDYYGTEIIAVDLDTLMLSRIRDSAASPQSYGAGIGALSDGTPRARHTYSNLAYLPSQDRYLLLGGARSPDGNMINDTWLWAPATDTYTALPNSPINRVDGFYGSAAAWDAKRSLVWAMDGTDIHSFNPANNTWNTPTQPSYSCGPCAEAGGTIDPVNDRWYVIGGGAIRFFSITANSSYALVEPATTGCSVPAGYDGPGVQYDPVQNRVVIWNGGNTVYLLNTSTHACTSVNYSGGPAKVSNNTYSRFLYSSTSNVFVTCQSVSAPCYTLRLTPNTPDTLAPAAPSQVAAQ